MKKIRSIIVLLCLIGSSCTLNLQEDPNAVQPNQILPSLVLNSIQRNVAGFFNGASGVGAVLTRQMNAGSSAYNTVITPVGFDGLWSLAYANILQDAQSLIKSSDETGLARHAGMARVLAAYTLLTLADGFGDVPYSEAFQGSGNFNPAVDDDLSVYNEAIAMLKKAKTDLTTLSVASGGYLNATAPVITDLYYNNNYGYWVRLANSLLLKAYLNLRLTNVPGATAGINDAIASGLLITNTDHNFVFRYGTNTGDPDSRHPSFVGQYSAGGGPYQSNWFIWHMFHGYDATHNGGTTPGDPRMRFYFYRQTNTNNSDPNNIRCIIQAIPAHYPQASSGAILDNAAAGRPPLGVGVGHPSVDGTDPAWGRTFCYPTDRGYWGRDHVDPQGIPPDNFLRTAFGAYPVGGRFDANNPANVGAGLGMRGAGMQPIMMRSFVKFMQAEAALFLTTTGSPRTLYREGIENSLDDVRNWAKNGTFGIGSASPNESASITAFYSDANFDTDKLNYVASALAAYDDRVAVSATEAMNYIAREYWIAAFGNGVEAYNLYRRTGLPSGMQPALTSAPGKFPRSFWYPLNFVNLNSTVEQKPDLSGKVFWDNTTKSLDF